MCFHGCESVKLYMSAHGDTWEDCNEALTMQHLSFRVGNHGNRTTLCRWMFDGKEGRGVVLRLMSASAHHHVRLSQSSPGEIYISYSPFYVSSLSISGILNLLLCVISVITPKLVLLLVSLLNSIYIYFHDCIIKCNT